MKKITLSFLLSWNCYSLSFYTTHLPPFSTVNNSKVHGPIKELITQACNHGKLDCNFEAAPWKRIMTFVRKGKFDGCFVFGKTAKREEWAYYTTPIVSSEYGFFHIKGKQAPILNYHDLKGKKVVVHQSSSTHRRLIKLQKQKPFFEIITKVDIKTVLRMYTNNRFEKDTYLYGNKEILLDLAKREGHQSLKYSFKHTDLNYHIGISKQSVKRSEFERLNNSLLELKKSSAYKKILNKYNLSVPI